jgi:S1/P1 Nuclease.
MKKAKCIATLTLIFFSLQATAFGWGDTGHMTVAQIAFNNLSPAQKNRVNQLAALIRLQDKRYEFVTSACWMDDIRDFPMFEPIKDWHFITQQFIVNNAVPVEPPPPVNAASIIMWLKGRIKSDEPDLKKAYYLAELVHLVGDIHQPLHTVTRFTVENPQGDRGGNLFLLGQGSPRKNLHSYWDAAGGRFDFTDIERPLKSSGRTKLQNFANKITTDFPKSNMTAEVTNLNPLDWAKEGFTLGVNEVYKDIQEQDVPSSDYQKKAKRISGQRIALAGYRLAAILKDAF